MSDILAGRRPYNPRGREDAPELRPEVRDEIRTWLWKESPDFVRGLLLSYASLDRRRQLFLEDLIEDLPSSVLEGEAFFASLVRAAERLLPLVVGEAYRLSDRARAELYDAAVTHLDDYIEHDLSHRGEGGGLVPFPNGSRLTGVARKAHSLLILSRSPEFGGQDPIGSALDRVTWWLETVTGREATSLPVARKPWREPSYGWGGYLLDEPLASPLVEEEHLIRLLPFVRGAPEDEVKVLAHPRLSDSVREREIDALRASGDSARIRGFVECALSGHPSLLRVDLVEDCVRTWLAQDHERTDPLWVASQLSPEAPVEDPSALASGYEMVWREALSRWDRQEEGAPSHLVDRLVQLSESVLAHLPSDLRGRILSLAGEDGRRRVWASLESVPEAEAPSSRKVRPG